MIWVVLGWVLIGLFILAIEVGWLALVGTLMREGGSRKDRDNGSMLMFFWVVAHLAALIMGGILLVQHGLSQVG
ncbi:membrane protein [Gordonia phage Survivors]|uniref:Membrane protein n=1 Tax=Gordonia phage Azira TaxID=3035369 RepID=A0AAF0GJ47_9CAUD|nr:membrane protein [Gordonia phage Azira]UVK59640.1 membrane protein [Gordonia phage Survivors]WGH21072.1 membrane protein [Gordonia phage Azira]